MDYLYLIIFALLPSLIWLLFFLKKDANPESNEMILKVFLWGMFATLPIISLYFFIEALDYWIETIDLIEGFLAFISSSTIIYILYLFLGIALVEEVLKYLVVRGKVLKNSELDEPLDVMLYMIIAALGFAALENILYLFQAETLPDVLWTNLLRFIAPVFGHALWSGTLGYFLALSFYEPRQKLKLLLFGFFLASFLHASFNYVIIKAAETDDQRWLIWIIIMIISLAISVTLGFKRLQKLKSVCKIYPAK